MDLYRMYIPGTSCTQCQPDSSVHSLILCVFLIIPFSKVPDLAFFSHQPGYHIKVSGDSDSKWSAVLESACFGIQSLPHLQPSCCPSCEEPPLEGREPWNSCLQWTSRCPPLPQKRAKQSPAEDSSDRRGLL